MQIACRLHLDPEVVKRWDHRTFYTVLDELSD